MKVYFLQELIPSYRVPVFRRLAKLQDVKLTLFYSEPSREHRMENLQNANEMIGFDSVKIPLFEVGHIVYQFAFLKYVISDNPDVIIAGPAGRLDSLLLLLLTRIMRIRLLWFAGGVPHADEKRMAAYSNRGRLYSVLKKHNPRRWVMAQADGMIVYSDHAKQYYSSLGFPEYKIWVAPNSPDTEQLKKYRRELEADPAIMDQLKHKYSPNGEKIVYMLGRLNAARRTEVLLEAFRVIQYRYPNTALIVVGDGYERPNLERVVKDESLSNVYFLGAIYDDRILTQYFLLCDVFVTPGIASLALKNAMTVGRPVVSGDYGLEVHAIKHGENGFIVPVGNAKALASAICLLFEDEDLWKRISAEASATIDSRINIRKMIDGFRAAIEGEQLGSQDRIM